MFQHAIVRSPGENFAQGLTTYNGAPPVYTKALEQHAAYCSALERCGLEVVRLDPDLAYPDSTFVEDVAVLTPRFAVLARPGADSRAGEVDGIRGPLERFFEVTYEIVAPGTLDGGDICEAGKHFFIGVSHRTNEEGAHQLASFLARGGYTSSIVDIRPISSILHLKSGLAYLDQGQLVVCEELAGFTEFRNYELVRVAAEESYAANCVRVNDYVLFPEGFPDLAATLVQRGFKLVLLDVSEFRKMDGGLSCLSLRF